MNRAVNRPVYPENVYCIIFGCLEYPDLPADAEATLEYVAKTLTPLEADMFMLNLRDEMTYVEIAEQYGLKKQRVQLIISRAIRKLRYSIRNEIISVGREAYLRTVLAADAEEKMRYYKRISELETLIRKQAEEINESIGTSGVEDVKAPAYPGHNFGSGLEYLDVS